MFNAAFSGFSIIKLFKLELTAYKVARQMNLACNTAYKDYTYPHCIDKILGGIWCIISKVHCGINLPPFFEIDLQECKVPQGGMDTLGIVELEIS